MKLQDFYSALDAELEQIIVDYPQDKRLHQNQDGKKTYALLIWFLQFYGRKAIHTLYITEGDGDNSCDIIFPNIDTEGNKIYYVVQSKWNNASKINSKFDSGLFRSTLADFQNVLLGKKALTRNLNFNKNYEELKEHLKANGMVKFVYLTLSQNNPSVQEIKESFEKLNNCDLEIIDIERLRRDFIEARYKEIKSDNPLEYDYNPEVETIKLHIEQLDIDRNYLELKAPFESYIFFVRPKTIHDLFQRYGFKIFFRNIRNPLLASDYNRQIADTLKNNPSFFWYFNNGITAITQSLPKKVNSIATQIDITGLQVINGAQTFYAIYKAYKEAKNGEKHLMNEKTLITFRLVSGGNKDFELDITRYTNQQNETHPRDFWANDPIQIRLQNESFKTDFWYEIRRGEFRKKPKNVKEIDNIEFAKVYLSVFLQKPYLVNEEFIFVSSKNAKNGLYETIFNENTHFEDMLAVYKLATNPSIKLLLSNNKFSQKYLILGLFRTVFEKLKTPEIPFSKELNRLLETEKGIIFITKIQLFILKQIKDADNEINKNFFKFVITLLSSETKFDYWKKHFAILTITQEDIEAINIEETLKELFGKE